MPLSRDDIVSRSGPTFEPVPGVVLNASPVDEAAAVLPLTTLPTSPTDGDEAVLTDSTTVPTYTWRMMWSDDAAKWLFVGGSPLTSSVATSETTTSTTYADLATAGPSVTLPRAGTYDIFYESTSQNTNGTSISPNLGGTTPADVDKVINNTGIHLTLGRWKRFTGLTASEVIKLQYKSNSGVTTATFFERRLSVLPVTLT